MKKLLFTLLIIGSFFCLNSISYAIDLGDGRTLFGSIDGTYNENIIFDFEAGENLTTLGTDSSTSLRYDMSFFMNDNEVIAFGAGEDANISWETEGNHSLQMVTRVASTDWSGYVTLVEFGDMSSANRSPDSDWPNGATPADPTWCVMS
ncbi:unnamed protein product, partial [marine sediment metagenome]